MLYIIHIIQRCNLNCVYCFEGRRLRRPEPALDLIRLKDIYAKIHKYHRSSDNKRIMFEWTGGETLLIPARRWRSILDLQKESFPKSYQVFNNMQTNLLSLTRDMIKVIQDFDIGVGVSYDFTDNTRLLPNGKDSSERVFKNMQRLRKAKIPFGVICVVTSENIDRLEEIYDNMCENGISFHFIPCMYVPYKKQRKYLVDAKTYALNLLPIIKKYYSDQNTSIDFDNALSYASILIRNCSNEAFCIHKKYCAEKMIHISCDGDVFPCPGTARKEFLMGNIFDQDLDVILDPSNPVKSIFAKRLTTVDKACRSCRWEKICNRGCVERAIHDGDIHGKSTFDCAVNRIIFPELTEFFKAHGYSTYVR